MYVVKVMIGVQCPPETTPIALIAIIIAIPNDIAIVTIEGVKNPDLSTSDMHPRKRRIIEAITSERNKVAHNKYCLLTIFATDLENSRNSTDLFEEPR